MSKLLVKVHIQEQPLLFLYDETVFKETREYDFEQLRLRIQQLAFFKSKHQNNHYR